MRRVGIKVFVLIALFTFANSDVYSKVTPKLGVADLADVLFDQSGIKDNAEALAKFKLVLTTLTKKQKQYKQDKDFIEYLYYFTHRKLFKKYEQYPSLAETLTIGEYDCLTATAVYSILLTELSVPHAVVETNYHIYLLVYPDTENEILLEATDPRYGFIADRTLIEKHKLVYRQDNKDLKTDQVDLKINIERRLEGQELIGLLYYNLSVKELNLGNWQKANDLAAQANEFYPNIRVRNLMNFIDNSMRSASL